MSFYLPIESKHWQRDASVSATKYKVTCADNATGEAQFSAEALGCAYGKAYATKREAEALAEELRNTVEDYGLPTSLGYGVEEVRS